MLKQFVTIYYLNNVSYQLCYMLVTWRAPLEQLILFVRLEGIWVEIRWKGQVLLFQKLQSDVDEYRTWLLSQHSEAYCFDFCHFSFQKHSDSVKLPGHLLCTVLFQSPHRFWIGFRPWDLGGSFQKPCFCWSHSVDLEVCYESLLKDEIHLHKLF